MTNRLLDRQVSLLDHLTSAAAIFGGFPHRTFLGIDSGLLHLEARFSYEKRLAKIAAVFPRTFALLGEDRAALLRAFVESCPPDTIGRIENARQFHDFLVARWEREAPQPCYLRDVAACEFACARIQLDAQDREPAQDDDAPSSGIRRRPGVILLRCGHDIRPLFETESDAAAPAERDTPLAIAIPPGADDPQVFELAPVIFDLLEALELPTDPTAFGDTPGMADLLRDLAQCGLVEVVK